MLKIFIWISTVATGLTLAVTADAQVNDRLSNTPRDANGISTAEPRSYTPVRSPDDERCREQLIETYGEDAQAMLQRQPATPEQPLAYYAVDHRVDYCSLLVMFDGTKRLPPAPSQSPLMSPAQ